MLYFLFKRLFFIVLTLCFVGVSSAQSTIGNLMVEYKSPKSDALKKTTRLKIVDHYLYQDKQMDSVKKYINTPFVVQKDSLFYAKLEYRTSVYNIKRFKFSLSEENAKRALSIFDKNESFYDAAKAQKILGDAYQAMFKNKLALLNYNEASKILEGEDRISLYTGYAAVYYQLNDLDQSIAYYNKAYNTSNKLGVDSYLFNIHNGMAGVYSKNNNLENVIASLRKALDVAITKKYKVGQMMSLHNLGFQYKLQNDCETAVSYFEQALRLSAAVGNKYIVGQIYYKYADCLVDLGELDKATDYANKAEVILTQLKRFGRLPYALRTKANIEAKKGHTEKAIIILEQAIALSEKNENTSITSDLYLKLAENYSKYNDAEKTFEAYNKHEQIKDSLNARKKTKEIETVKAKFEASILETKLKQDLELLSSKNKASSYRNILLAIIVIALVYFIFQQRKIYKVKQKLLEDEKDVIASSELLLKDKVKYKNSQITEYAILIDERNKFLDKIKEQIGSIRDLSNDVNQKKMINHLQFFIKDNVSVKREKVDLDKTKTNDEESFRFNLEQKFPKLTDKELVICRLLLLNLTSKQISQKMEITVQSVNNYRASIRKKVNLKSGENLKRFLKNI